MAAPLTNHFYPRAPEFRLSGGDFPQIGDRALCGSQKVTPPDHVVRDGSELGCPVCIDLLPAAIAEWEQREAAA